MIRYIDAEWLLNFFEPYPDDYHTPLGTLRACVDDAPSIDIVFCKECKNREKYPCNEITFYECSHLRLYGTKVGVEDDWFCADGERSE